MHEEAGSIRWAPRVPPILIRRLYVGEAKGLLDNAVLEDVGHRLFERCRDILLASAAMVGAATCPRCDATVAHDGRAGTRLRCGCGWTMRWSSYERTFRDRWLRGGRATPYFESFVETWPIARDATRKMFAIDAVLHAIHADGDASTHGRHAAPSVIEAAEDDARALLDELAGRPAHGASRDALHARWRDVDRRPHRNSP